MAYVLYYQFEFSQVGPTQFSMNMPLEVTNRKILRMDMTGFFYRRKKTEMSVA